ncbi:KaiC domain-containing protein [Archaeoglobus sp.]
MEKLSTGVEGLDRMLEGGIPKGHIVTVVGAYGTGKTTLALQYIYAGLENGENCMYISFDEDEESILQDAESFGMNFRDYLGKNLEIVKLEAIEVKESLRKIKSDLPMMIQSSNVQRIVLDSISVFETLFDEAERWKALATLRDILKKAGVTAIITSEANKSIPTVSKYGILEYISDGVICLKFVRRGEFEETTLGIEIVKMRRVRHSRKVRPYAITENGIVVYEEAEIF